MSGGQKLLQLGRYGEDEFGLLHPGEDGDLRRRVREAGFETCQLLLEVSDVSE